jgi:poly(3-hydroxybutyrate) depolymerase
MFPSNHARGALLLALVILAPGSPSPAQSRPAATTRGDGQRRLPRGFLRKTIALPDGQRRRYAVFVPPQYALHPEHNWPVILFLHGSGERGGNGIKQTRIGLPTIAARHPMKFPFILVMPQAKDMWYRGSEAAAAWTILDEVHREYRTDRDRVYLTGLSMGGFGTWELAARRPDVFAAIVPVCGVAPLPYLSNLVNVPVWAFHGALDDRVPVSGSRDAVAELKRLGAEPKYTEYPHVNHFCWDDAYGTPELLPWLLKHRRPPPPAVIDYVWPAGRSRVWWLAVEAEAKLKEPARVHVEIQDGGRVIIESENTRAWGLVSEAPPLAPGMEIEIVWNKKLIYRGPFEGVLNYTPPSPARTESRPGGRDDSGSGPPPPQD